MAFLFDAFILVFVGLGIFAEVRRGLFFALFDVVRVVGGIVAGFGAYSLCHRLFHSYTAGFIGFGVAALAVVILVPAILWWLKTNPAWGMTRWGRAGAGIIGLVIGGLVAAVFVPVLGRTRAGQTGVSRSVLARPFLETMPALYYAADAFNLDLPMLNTRAIRFEDEGRTQRAALVDRINYSKLNGATCIECGAPVHFNGYFRRVEVSVSPRFTCPICGRTSDGCQTFEGFHRMYGHCPVDVSEALGPIDCGVWPNDRPVYPRGVCPVDGKPVH
ncbi:MAG: CvpA family protein [candidate division WOR-3 bacterium]|nr:CvpA family protein [candidate division WOR-3 bacterium]